MSRVISFGETHGKIPFSHWTEERKPGKNGKMKLLTFFFFFSLALFCTPYLLLMQSPNAPRLTPRVIKEGAKKKEERKRSWHHDGLFLLASKWQKSNVAESPSSRKFLFFFLLFLFLFFSSFFFFIFSFFFFGFLFDISTHFPSPRSHFPLDPLVSILCSSGFPGRSP